MANHGLSTRTCPQCKQERSFQNRLKYCSAVCANVAKTRRIVDRAQTPEERSEVHLLRARHAEMVRRLKTADAERSEALQYQHFFEGVRQACDTKPAPAWSRKTAHKPGRSIFLSPLSDIHFEETVDPEAMNYVNGYDRNIAKARLRRYFENVLKTAFDHLKGLRFEGAVMPFLGDFVTGWIHDELKESNPVGPTEAIAELLPVLEAGLNLVVSEFGSVLVPCVIGNHGRNTLKVRHKRPTNGHFDYLIYALLAERFAKDERVKFMIPRSTDVAFGVYGFRFMAEHGNLLKGGSNAISGIYPSVTLGNYRKKNVQQATNDPYDYLLIGDKHQLRFVGDVFINGSVIGYNEFARSCKFAYEPPQQLFFVVDPEHGPVVRGAIHVQGKDESWMLKKRTA